MSENINELTAGLESDEAILRQRCRHRLVKAGESAVPALTGLLDSGDDRLRWEAAMALAAIAAPASVPALVKALEDVDDRVRWDAAAGLVSIGKPSVEPVLQAMITRPKDGPILESGLHVIHELAHSEWGQHLHAVYEAGNTAEPDLSVPVAAGKALEELRDI